MLNFKIIHDKEHHESWLETSISGKNLLTTPQLNKGTAFSEEERHQFELLGKLPNRVETIDEQVFRAYTQYLSYESPLQKNIYLNNLHDKNQVLFYKLVSTYLIEMLPIIYTPIVGTAVKSFSREYRQPRGLYIAHTNQDQLDEILNNRSNPDIDLIVVTDGEGVLGIGDQGIGGMDIPVAKLMVYSLCGGIDPTRTLPIFLDVGTNNQELLNDPLYLGCRHPRISKEKYDVFIAKFVKKIQSHFPGAFLHWEDFGRDYARQILDDYKNQLCTFNDDIQGTGAVTLAALLAACNVTGIPLTEQRIVVFGGGSAGTGIGDQIVDAMIHQGLDAQEAYACFWFIDRQGLLVQSDSTLTLAQRPYAKDPQDLTHWNTEQSMAYPTFADVMTHVKPTILIGCSAQAGAFSQAMIESMSTHCPRPIIFPLSNPDEKCEAKPAQLMEWTQGQALIATGTAYPSWTGPTREICFAQCNNALVFPGIGLGIRITQAQRLSSTMLLAAAHALSTLSPCRQDPFAPLLPSLSDSKTIAKHIALAVAQCAIQEGLAGTQTTEELEEKLENSFWEPRYLPFVRV